MIFFPGRKGWLLCWCFKIAVSVKNKKNVEEARVLGRKRKLNVWRNKEGKEKWDNNTEKKECKSYREKRTTVKHNSQNRFSSTKSMDGLDELPQAAVLDVSHTEPGLHWACREIQTPRARECYTGYRLPLLLIWLQLRWRPESIRHGNWESGKLFLQE